MEGIELISFQIIASVGSARSLYIEAIHQAKLGFFEEAYKLIQKGNEAFVEGHQVHANLIEKEANGERNEIQVLLVHALDLLMSAEAFGILAIEFIDIYKTLYTK